MRGNLIFSAALAAALTTPALADGHQNKPANDPKPVIAAADAFFAALRSEDKTALARTMLPEGMIFIHNRQDPENPRMATRNAGEHTKGWVNSPPGTDEYMRYDTVLVDGRMAHVWGPYVFILNGKPTHCGINSMSFAKTEDGWRVSNTSFTMTALDECETLGAPEVPTK
ncbi:MAG: hypothetical protein HRT64_11875 [Erythrobacter sp.]|nr:hypothetical protein [Erythrobacter sp.]